MKRSLTWAGLRLNKLKLAGAIELITCIVCANVVAALGHHFNQVAADTIASCIGGQIPRSMPLLASMSSGVDPGSIVTQIAMPSSAVRFRQFFQASFRSCVRGRTLNFGAWYYL